MARKSTINNYCVYVHINKINGKMYIGQSYNIKERWRCKGKNYFNSIKFFNAIKKYGWDNFYHLIIDEGLTIEEADALEKSLIQSLDTINNGYNLKEGGARGALSPKSLKKMGDSVRKTFTEHPEIKEKIRQAHLGYKASDEAKRNMMLNGARTLLININGEIGSMRYWARRIGCSHIPLVYRKKKQGYEAMIEFIKYKLNTAPAGGVGVVQG